MSDTVDESAKEGTSLGIKTPKVIAVTNNLETYREEAVHFISVILHTQLYGGKPKVMEPGKCEAWDDTTQTTYRNLTLTLADWGLLVI